MFANGAERGTQAPLLISCPKGGDHVEKPYNQGA